MGKITAFSTTAGRLYGGADGIGRLLASGAIAVELGCRVALLIGLFTPSAAVALIFFTIAATVMFHNFWAAPEAQVVVQTIALTLIAALGAGSISADAVLGRQAPR